MEDFHPDDDLDLRSVEARVLLDYALDHKTWDRNVYGNLDMLQGRMLKFYLDLEDGEGINCSNFIDQTEGVFKGRIYLRYPSRYADKRDKEILEKIFVKAIESFAPEIEAEKKRKKLKKRKMRKQRKLEEVVKEDIEAPKEDMRNSEWDSNLEEEYQDFLDSVKEGKDIIGTSESDMDNFEEEIADKITDDVSKGMPETIGNKAENETVDNEIASET